MPSTGPSEIGPSRIGRLKKRAEFLKVAAARAKWVTPGLILQARRRQAPEGAADIRVGFTVSRKVGGAVVRNRARRRLRHAAERVMPDQAAGARDYVLIGRRTTIDRPFEDLVTDLETALARLGALRDRADMGTTQGSERRIRHETR